MSTSIQIHYCPLALAPLAMELSRCSTAATALAVSVAVAVAVTIFRFTLFISNFITYDNIFDTKSRYMHTFILHLCICVAHSKSKSIICDGCACVSIPSMVFRYIRAISHFYKAKSCDVIPPGFAENAQTPDGAIADTA